MLEGGESGMVLCSPKFSKHVLVMMPGVSFLCPTWSSMLLPFLVLYHRPGASLMACASLGSGLQLGYLPPPESHTTQLLQLLISREYNPQKALAKELECDHHWLPAFLDNNIPTFEVWPFIP